MTNLGSSQTGKQLEYEREKEHFDLGFLQLYQARVKKRPMRGRRRMNSTNPSQAPLGTYKLAT